MEVTSEARRNRARRGLTPCLTSGGETTLETIGCGNCGARHFVIHRFDMILFEPEPDPDVSPPLSLITACRDCCNPPEIVLRNAFNRATVMLEYASDKPSWAACGKCKWCKAGCP